jgi:hypothetical protein
MGTGGTGAHYEPWHMEVSGQPYAPAVLSRRKNACTQWTGKRAGPTADLDVLENRKLPTPATIRTRTVKRSSSQTHFDEPNKVSMLYQTRWKYYKNLHLTESEAFFKGINSWCSALLYSNFINIWTTVDLFKIRTNNPSNFVYVCNYPLKILYVVDSSDMISWWSFGFMQCRNPQ